MLRFFCGGAFVSPNGCNVMLRVVFWVAGLVLLSQVATVAEPASLPDGGTLVGKIVLGGDAPTLAPLIKSGVGDIKDKEVCGAADVPDESLVVGEGNGIANVFVYLRRAPKGFKAAAPKDPVVLDQKGCVFLPHVALIQVGQKVLVKSSDAVQHNIHSFPTRNSPVNMLIKPNEDKGVEMKYAKAESDPLDVRCDIHGWMSSYHLVLDHPFMAVTDKNGNFRIEGLPAGSHEFRVWHERGQLLEKELKVDVKAGGETRVDLEYPVTKFPSGRK
ncbi:MAG: carboxypeptidase regulatory-like domain-containing protein [Planctomycetota bacterium]